MSIDPDELAKFKAALSRTPTDIIQQRLDDNHIARQWKRDLAEQEIARRTSGTTSSMLQKLKLHKSATLKGWLVTVVLLVCALAVGLTFLMEKLPR